MTAARRHATLPLLLAGLAIFAVLAIIPRAVEAQTPPDQSPTGQPIIHPSAEGAGILLVDTLGIDDPNGLALSSNDVNFSYQWIRVDGDTSAETNVGDGSTWYQSVTADVGHKIKVEVSFTDGDGYSETVTSVAFGPIAALAGPPVPPSAPTTTLVANTGQTTAATAMITQQYAMGFRLGDHGQGYEISSVSIDLAAAPSSLTVSLWIGSHADHAGEHYDGSAAYKLFDFENPPSFQVGLNKFTAPPGAFAYQNVKHFIVLSGFGSSLSIKETTSDGEDPGGEPQAVLLDSASVRALGSTGLWTTFTTRASVLRMAVEGSQRHSGILASSYAQAQASQEIISVGDEIGLPITLGAADRYLIRGFSWVADSGLEDKPRPMYNPFDVRSGWTSGNPTPTGQEEITAAGTKLFSLIPTRYGPGINAWAAPQGATVAGGSSYLIYENYTTKPADTVLSRVFTTGTDVVADKPALGVTFPRAVGDFAGRPLVAVLGEPLHAMVQNLGQTDNSFALADSANSVLSQGFTTGSNADGYDLKGIGVNIEGSVNTDGDAQVPDGPLSVSAAVYTADSDGKPGAKLFDLVSPAEFAAGHSFFEAPAATTLDPSTAYVLVWQHTAGTAHRLQRTLSNNEDAGAIAGFTIVDAFYRGADLANLAENSGGNSLEIAVYGAPRPNATGRPVILASAEDPSVLAVDTSGIGDPDGIPNVGTATGTGILHDFSYRWMRVDGDTETVVSADSDDYRQISGEFHAAGIRIESGRYRRVEADVGKLLKVEVSFTDHYGAVETVTSVAFGPIPGPAAPLPESTLVSNTAQSASATEMITGPYTMGFKLGAHGQGYEISGVSIELAAAPPSLTVSLWMGRAPGSSDTGAHTKLFDFENPPSFAAGLNEFAAPAGAFAYQNVDYYIVLSDFGATLSIKQTTSDDEDEYQEPGATLQDKGSRTGVLRLAVKGSRRQSGILTATYAQEPGIQEIISTNDESGIDLTVGAADRYLIRGVSFSGDNTATGGPFTDPWEVRDATDELFRLINTRQISGINEFTALQGATVPGGPSKTYSFFQEVSDPHMGGVAVSRYFGTASTAADSPKATGVAIGSTTGDFSLDTPLMAVFGEPLFAMVQNLGQTDNGYREIGGSSVKVVSQGFTTGPDPDGYQFQGIGVNIEGSNSRFPDGPLSVSTSVHADSGGKPGRRLFDLVSPGEYAAGHSFFEAPAGSTLDASTSYVVVWKHNSGTVHRLVKTSSSSEDAGARAGFAIADAFYQGVDLDNMTVDSNGDALEIAVYSRSRPNATGRPVVLASAEDPGVLAVDTSGIGDPDGIPNVGDLEATGILHDFSYRWIRVDGNTETTVGADSDDYRQIAGELHAAGIRIESGRYRRVEADIGKLLKVEVSFTDDYGGVETVSSLPFGPVPRPARPLPESTLVANTAQSPSATAVVSGPYAMGFKLGAHGQGYEISGVSIDLAAAPSALTVSLWTGRAPGSSDAGLRHTKLFDFENPSSLGAGLNTFSAPRGAFAYQNVDYFVVLSGFGRSLSITETTSDNEDSGGETGATIQDKGSRTGVLRMAVKGSQRTSGILASNYAKTADATATPPITAEQEIVSVADSWDVGITVGTADRYLIRGVTFSGDDAFAGGLFAHPFDLLDGTDALFRLVSTRQVNGINEWTAPQGATVAGGCTTDEMTMTETCETYDFKPEVTDPVSGYRFGGVVTARYFGTSSTEMDEPTAPGVTFGSPTGNFVITRTFMAVLGEPLVAMAQNVGQADNSYVSLGGASAKVVSQGFSTGPDEHGYRLQGIGVDVEGSDNTDGNAQVPDGPLSVSVSVHVDVGGKPGAKLFDLVSPADVGAGHGFFEAPPGTQLKPDTSYVLVWRYNGGTGHRLHQTTSDAEDSGGVDGFSISDSLYRGADLDNLSEDTNSDALDSTSNALQISVYGVINTEAPRSPFIPGGHPVTERWLHIPDDVGVGDQFRVVFVTHRGILPTSGDIGDYNDFVRQEAAGTHVRGEEVDVRYTDRVIRRVAEEFTAVVCTASVDARANTAMPVTEIGVPVHWLDGGWDNEPTLIADSYDGFYSGAWENTEYGAYVTGNSAYFHENAMVWTGCDSSGAADPLFPMGTNSMGLVAVGSPRDPAANNAPIGAVDVSVGRVTGNNDEYRPIYGISPVFTVVP